MADKKSEITNNLETIRKGIYGKDVREAIASGLELCYDYAGGQAILDDIDRLEGVVSDSENAINKLREAASTADDLVIISDTQPTSPDNKIWIKPQAENEYKVASFAAYEELWNRMNEVEGTYQQGHGGIASITLDSSYSDPEDSTKKKYIIAYTDESTDEIYIHDGAKGDPGPQDSILGCEVKYHLGVMNNGVLDPNPPLTGWTTTMPAIRGGQYLWTQTVIHYVSGQEAYHYGINYMGIDGSGAVDGIKIGSDMVDTLTGIVTIPLDSTPTAGHSINLMSSAAIKSALDNLLINTALTGTPTAPTPTDQNDSSTAIANTSFVHSVVDSAMAPKLSGKTFSILGDGNSAFNGYVPSFATEAGLTSHFPSGDVVSADDMWWGVLAQKTGMTMLKDESWSVNRALSYASSDNTWPSRLADGTTAPDYIFVYIGVNDWGSMVPLGTWTDNDPSSGSFPLSFDNVEDLTFARAIAQICYMLTTTYKQAKIYCCTFYEPYGGYRAYVPDVVFPRKNTATVPTTTSQFNEIIRKVTDCLGVGLIDLRRESGINFFTESVNTFTADGLYLNKAGMERVADAIARAIL